MHIIEFFLFHNLSIITKYIVEISIMPELFIVFLMVKHVNWETPLHGVTPQIEGLSN